MFVRADVVGVQQKGWQPIIVCLAPWQFNLANKQCSIENYVITVRRQETPHVKEYCIAPKHRCHRYHDLVIVYDYDASAK